MSIDPKKIIDIHLHTVDTDVVMQQDLLDYVRTLGAGVLLASSFEKSLQKRELSNTTLIHLIDHSENLLGFLAYPMDEYTPPGNELKHKKIVGVKFYTGYYSFDEDIISRYMDACIAEGIGHFMFHGGFCNIKNQSRVFHPGLLEGIICKYPMVSIIIAHLGTPHSDTVYDLMQKYAHVYTDVSGLFAGKNTIDFINKKEILLLRRSMRKIRDEKHMYARVLFGTDYPIIDVQAYAQFARLLDISYDDIYAFSDHVKTLLKINYV